MCQSSDDEDVLATQLVRGMLGIEYMDSCRIPTGAQSLSTVQCFTALRKISRERGSCLCRLVS